MKKIIFPLFLSLSLILISSSVTAKPVPGESYQGYKCGQLIWITYPNESSDLFHWSVSYTDEEIRSSSHLITGSNETFVFGTAPTFRQALRESRILAKIFGGCTKSSRIPSSSVSG